MNVAVIASEAVPFAKTGGLADVAGSLPRALERLGHTASLFLPRYRQVDRAGLPITSTGLAVRIPIGSKDVEGSVYSSRLPRSNVTVYLIDQAHYFGRSGFYQEDGEDYPDNPERFIFFERAVLEAIRLLELRPEVMHCNDWETGLIPVYLAEVYRNRPGFEAVGTLFTIHNLAYQGRFAPQVLSLAGLDGRLFNWRQLEFHGQVSFLKAGLVFADIINTVSPTYAREIQTPERGCGLDGLLRARPDDLRGIVNGIDTSVWSPSLEPMIARNYDVGSVVEGKAACKAALQRLAGLPERPEVPLFAQIGRLVPEKGWDLLGEVADDLLRGDVQMVVLGQGLPHYHGLLGRLEERHAGKLRAFLEFSAPRAHQIEAGADLFLLPSLVEPCGLNQLYSLAHGTVPVVHATGGLADTVVDVTPQTLADGTATGFLFLEPTPRALKAAVDRALALWPDRKAWSRLVRTGMSQDWSWERSARAYVELYQEVSRRAWANARQRSAVGMAM